LAYTYLLHTLLNKGEFFDINNIETMEITSFILGVLAVIAIMMVAITSVNYMAFKILKRDFDNYVSSTERVLADIYRDNETARQELHSRITETEQAVVRHTDSRVDKLERKVYKDFDVFGQQGKPY
jgi:hypothetical protein